MAKFGSRYAEDYDTEQLAKGIAVEREHRGIADYVLRLTNVLNMPLIIVTPEDIYREIAMDHLDEDPNYYRALEHMEKNLKKLRTPRWRVPKIIQSEQAGRLIVAHLQYSPEEEVIKSWMTKKGFERLLARIVLVESGADPELVVNLEDATGDDIIDQYEMNTD